MSLLFFLVLMFILLPHNTKNNSRYKVIGKGWNQKVKDTRTNRYLIT